MWFYFEPWHLLCFVILGSVVGWLAGRAFPGRGLGLRGNVVLGVIGGVAGGLFSRCVWYFDFLNYPLNVHLHPLGFGVLVGLWYLLWFVIVGGLVGRVVGRELFGPGSRGHAALAVIGTIFGTVSFCLVGTFVGGLALRGLMTDLFNAAIGAFLCLAIVIIFVRRR